jgi:hypothetical protein
MHEGEAKCTQDLVGKPEGWRLLAGRGIDHWFLNCGL